MTKITWTNSTKLHPNGVCESATALWLKLIYGGTVADANKIKPTDCDTLQARVEAGESLILPDVFKSIVGSNINFDPFSNSIVLKSVTPAKVLTAPQIQALLAALVVGDFWYISANTPANLAHGGHALALYRDRDALYFFDPNTGIYSAATAATGLGEIAQAIITTTTPWKDVAAMPGHMNNK